MKRKKRIGTVALTFAYNVDLDDKDMVDRAKRAIFDDVTELALRGSSEDWDAAFDVKKNEKLTERAIPDFLTETE